MNGEADKTESLNLRTPMLESRFIPFCLFVGVAGILACVSSAQAAQQYRVNNNTSVFVDEHSVPKNVQNNNCGADIMVPTNTSTEWSAFRNNKPACVVLTDGADCDLEDMQLHAGAEDSRGSRRRDWE